MKIRFLIKLLFIFLALSASFGQEKSNTSESMIWTEGIEKVKLNNRFSSTLLWQHRIFFDREETYQDIYWLSIAGNVSQNLSLTGGIMYFTYHKESFGRHLTVPEWRPFQAVTYSKSFGAFRSSFRCMVEQRYTRRVGPEGLQRANDFNLRVRNRLQLLVPIQPRWQVEFSEEVLLRNLQNGNRTFDQSRARIRLHCHPGLGDLSVNAGYLHWLVSTASALQHRHAAMVGVSHKIN